MNVRELVLVGVVLGAVAGCGGSTPEVDAEQTADDSGGEVTDRRAPAIAAAQSPTGDPSGAGRCEVGTIYFDFDSDALDGRARDVLDAVARCMLRGGAATIVLIGATDPRGTEEYNLALGDRRALSVKDYLRRLGVDERQLHTRSVGEEWAQGQDEAGWSRDRRVTGEVASQ